MFFQESDSIASKDPDLLQVVEQIDQQLCGIASSTPLRPADFACFLGADENQVTSAFELLAAKGILLSEKMVECEGCQNLMSASEFLRAIDDEDEFECTTCGRVFRADAEPLLVYRMATQALTQVRAKAQPRSVGGELPSGDEPLGERAQDVLVAMLELGAVDSDTRRSTEDIASKALGPRSDANALKSVMADLKTRQLIGSKTGRNGGCWLTDKGKLRATKLRPS
jgi:hypothetical protein